MRTSANNRIDLAGRKFGRLTVISYSHTNHHRKAFWNCVCECGVRKAIMGLRLVSGHTKSCGCQKSRKGNPIHGGAGSPTYQSWDNAKQRCFNARHHTHALYGGRGITMCDRWRKSFTAFLEDMGPRPGPEYSLDRYPNPNGNYEPGNCRWATASEQARNRRPRKTKKK
jgi:hypothetical protein